MDENRSKRRGTIERILRSRIARGIFRLHMGFSIFRSWSNDIQIPPKSSIHLFDYLLDRSANQEGTSKKGVENDHCIDRYLWKVF